jgi:hypothetical protein
MLSLIDYRHWLRGLGNPIGAAFSGGELGLREMSEPKRAAMDRES